MLSARLRHVVLPKQGADPHLQRPRERGRLSNSGPPPQERVVTASCSRRDREIMCYSAVNKYVSPPRGGLVSFPGALVIQFAGPSLRLARTSGRSRSESPAACLCCVLPVARLWEQAFTGGLHLCCRDCWGPSGGN